MAIPSVTLEPWPSFQLPAPEVKAVLQYLAHKMQKSVSFRRYTEGEGYTPQSVSVRVMVYDGLHDLYGLRQARLNGLTHVLTPDQKATAPQTDWKKIVDEEGQLVGCVDHNRLILPVDVTATDNEAARAILGYVVEQAIPLLDFDLDRILKEKEEEFTKHFGLTFQKSVRARLQTRQEEFDQRRRDAEQAYYSVLEFERERATLEEELKHLTSLVERPQSALARTQARALLQIQQSGLYSQVMLNDDGTLTATSSAITIEHDNFEFPLGHYEVEIPPDGDVRIKALDEHPNAEHPHPHVARDHRPCLGNISGDLAKLIGKLRLAEALQLIHSFLASYSAENPFEKIGHFDPSGQYTDEEDDVCENCDDRCTPYCIFSCESNNDFYTCADCSDYRGEFCFTECEHNPNFERFHPCEGCPRKDTERCFSQCNYNNDWQLQNPCDQCEHETCDDSCEHHRRKEEMDHVKAG